VLIQKESGGNLAEVLEKVAANLLDQLREIERFEAETGMCACGHVHRFREEPWVAELVNDCNAKERER